MSIKTVLALALAAPLFIACGDKDKAGETPSGDSATSEATKAADEGADKAAEEGDKAAEEGDKAAEDKPAEGGDDKAAE